MCAFVADMFRQKVDTMKRRRHFFTVEEYAKEVNYTPRHVRRLIKEGKINAQKIGRRFQIWADQSKKAKVEWHYVKPGLKVPIPPSPPDGLIWDMKKNKFVLIEKYAKEHGYQVTNKDGKKAILFPPALDDDGR